MSSALLFSLLASRSFEYKHEFNNVQNNLICRYEVNFQDGIDCGGAYIKLLSDSGSLSLVGDVHLTPLKRHLEDL